MFDLSLTYQEERALSAILLRWSMAEGRIGGVEWVISFLEGKAAPRDEGCSVELDHLHTVWALFLSLEATLDKAALIRASELALTGYLDLAIGQMIKRAGIKGWHRETNQSLKFQAMTRSEAHARKEILSICSTFATLPKSVEAC